MPEPDPFHRGEVSRSAGVNFPRLPLPVVCFLLAHPGLCIVSTETGPIPYQPVLKRIRSGAGTQTDIYSSTPLTGGGFSEQFPPGLDLLNGEG